MLKAFIFCTLTIALFGACNKEEDTAKVEIRLTDAPVAVDEVNVDVREVRVKFSDDTSANNGWVNLTTNAGVYNLLALQNGVDTLLASASLPQQTIKEIRLILGPDNSVTENGISYPLVIPSGSESGLKIKVNKKLNATLNTLVIDFDAALSLKKEGPGDYKLRPVLKIK
jgi:hypothetical protein